MSPAHYIEFSWTPLVPLYPWLLCIKACTDTYSTGVKLVFQGALPESWAQLRTHFYIMSSTA